MKRTYYTAREKESMVIISLDEYNALKETHYLLSHPANAQHLQRSIEQLGPKKL